MRVAIATAPQLRRIVCEKSRKLMELRTMVYCFAKIICHEPEHECYTFKKIIISIVLM